MFFSSCSAMSDLIGEGRTSIALRRGGLGGKEKREQVGGRLGSVLSSSVQAGYLLRGRSSIFRKNTSAPSDWKRILPFVWLDSVPRLTMVPLRMLVIVPPSQMHSRVFHSPGFFSTSFAPRKPSTSSQFGSRYIQLIRPPVNFLAGAPGL